MFSTPDNLFSILRLIVDILLVLLFANLIFYTALSIIGFRKPSRDYSIVDDEKKFLFIVPAHNEESVIGDTLYSLSQLNYEKKLYKIALIADNCDDRTAEIGGNYPDVTVFENQSNPEEPRGKPHAIARFLENNQWEDYDYISFIDADNIVHPDYLKEMNSQVCTTPELTAVQGYLGIKNLATSITASGYAAVYFITNRAVQYGKHLLGWNAAIGGTGFILSVPYLKEHGWNPRSYTEDFELQVELSNQGKRSTWNHFAKVYDEKPNSFIASHNQRTRWAQGHWFVGITTTPKQLKRIIKSNGIVELMNRMETLFYSYSMIRPVIYCMILFLSLIDYRLLFYLPNLFSLALYWGVIEIINFILVPFLYITQEGNKYFEQQNNIFFKMLLYIRLIVGFIWNSLTYLLAQLVGFATWYFPQNKWRKTAHSAVFEKE
ncbi:glycosyltransferase family 2 protein [Lactococcus lactis]|uniref:Glycosyltransferase family 2 protein n=1 Tax=Lactococcus lactis TaxID=1358 RepID=A0A9X4NIZ2_9LACT|nr:glycosyltransferase family 2 protein [Lactococcus lactis]MDG4984975.1 glycosyltransferase family 2 protein [Lactococcus lactis]